MQDYYAAIVLHGKNQYYSTLEQLIIGIVRKTDGLNTIIPRQVINNIKITLNLIDKVNVPEQTRIHEVRKALKRIRSILHLQRIVYTNSQFTDMDNRLKMAGRLMTELRESVVNYKIFCSLVDKYPNALNLDYTQYIKTELENKVNQLYADNKMHSSTILVEVKNELNAIEQLNRQIHTKNITNEDLIESFKLMYSKTAKAYEKAIEQPDTEIIHRWRKQSKFLLLQFRHVPFLSSENFNEIRSLLEDITDTLGKDHDMAIMLEYIINHLTVQDDSEIKLTELVNKRRLKHQSSAFSLGGKIF